MLGLLKKTGFLTVLYVVNKDCHNANSSTVIALRNKQTNKQTNSLTQTTENNSKHLVTLVLRGSSTFHCIYVNSSCSKYC